MSENGFTYEDFLRRTAERVGIARFGAAPNNSAQIPTDANLLAKLEQAVRDGAKYFERGQISPSGGPMRWSWLEMDQTLTLDPTGAGPRNIEEDAGHYLLDPEVASAPKGKVAWRHPTTGGGAGEVYGTDRDTVRKMLDACPETTGRPELCAMEPVARLSSAQRMRYSLVIFPRPDQAYLMRWRARVSPVPFANLTDRGMWPEIHDLAVLECMVCAYVQVSKQPSDPIRLSAESLRREAMQASMALDREMRPKSIGSQGYSEPGYASLTQPRTALFNAQTGAQIL